MIEDLRAGTPLPCISRCKDERAAVLQMDGQPSVQLRTAEELDLMRMAQIRASVSAPAFSEGDVQGVVTFAEQRLQSRKNGILDLSGIIGMCRIKTGIIRRPAVEADLMVAEPADGENGGNGRGRKTEAVSEIHGPVLLIPGRSDP